MIYSYRVDSVHTDAYKMLGAIQTSVLENENVEKGEGGENEEGEKKKKKRSKPERGVNTLETNVSNINAKRIDLEFSVDPLFRKTSAAFDEGGARGLLLNHLHVHDDCRIVFDSTDAAISEVEKENEREDVNFDVLPLLGIAAWPSFLLFSSCFFQREIEFGGVG